MRSVVIDGTELHVSRWSFGTGSLHQVFSSMQRRRLLDVAADVGFSHFDTSPYYGYGLAEIDLGRFIRHRRERVTVATKVGLYPNAKPTSSALKLWMRKGIERLSLVPAQPRVDWSVREAVSSLDASLSRLRTDYVDILFLHEPDPVRIASEEFLRWLENEVSKGRVRAWGLAGRDLPGLPWVVENHPLARLLQVKDSLQQREADALQASRRPLQFSYGYLSATLATTVAGGGKEQLAAILRRNRTGSIVISTRRAGRLTEFAEADDAA